MSRGKQKREQAKRQGNASLPDISAVASANECTGVLPAQTETTAERNAVAALGGIVPMPRKTGNEG